MAQASTLTQLIGFMNHAFVKWIFSNIEDAFGRMTLSVIWIHYKWAFNAFRARELVHNRITHTSAEQEPRRVLFNVGGGEIMMEWTNRSNWRVNRRERKRVMSNRWEILRHAVKMTWWKPPSCWGRFTRGCHVPYAVMMLERLSRVMNLISIQLRWPVWRSGGSKRRNF